MRTNIEIDDALLRRAMQAAGAKTKKDAVETAMRLTVQLHKQAAAIRKLWGIGWDGNLDEMRANEHLDWDPAWKDTDREKSRSVA